MSRFFVDRNNIYVDHVVITGEDVAHIKKVLRLKAGDRITVCDGRGTDYLAALSTFGPSVITAEIISSEKNAAEPPIEAILYQGLPKADKMELIVQKCVELGISRIVPVITDRTVVRIASTKDAENKLARWRKIAQEAAKQCNRGTLPAVESPAAFDAAMEKAGRADLALMPYENETGNGLKAALKKEGIKSVSIAIGPEGGFTEKEVELAKRCGILPVSLGPRILRTETAGFAVLTAVMYELGDIGRYYARKTE